MNAVFLLGCCSLSYSSESLACIQTVLLDAIHLPREIRSRMFQGVNQGLDVSYVIQIELIDG